MCNKQIKQSLGKFGDRTKAEFIDTNVSSSNELFETPIGVHGVTSAIDTISASEAQTMSKNNYYTSCLKDKRFLALLIEGIFYVIVLVACIALLVEVIHG